MEWFGWLTLGLGLGMSIQWFERRSKDNIAEAHREYIEALQESVKVHREILAGIERALEEAAK